MIDIKVNNENILIQIPKTLVSNSYLERFIERLEVEELTEKNQMTEQDAWNFSEEIKENRYKENQQKLSGILTGHE